MLVNEINQLPHLDKKLQFDFLLNSVRSRKRFTPWLKASKIEDLEYVKEYYGYSNDKAKQALDILTDEQIATVKQKLKKGTEELLQRHCKDPRGRPAVAGNHYSL